VVYAENTSVPISKSKNEIERIVTKYGADQYITAWDQKSGKGFIQFRCEGIYIKFEMTVPDINDDKFKLTDTGRERSWSQQEKEWEQEQRRKWRALALVIKAKLEAAQSGITTFQEEFLAHILLPNMQTAGQHLIPQIAQAYATKKMPTMLPMLEAPKGKRK